MSESPQKIREDAKTEGIFIVFLSGFWSINLQKEIFYSLKFIRNQVPKKMSRVSALPEFSEHNAGLTIDIGDYKKRNTDFELEFENTDAFLMVKE